MLSTRVLIVLIGALVACAASGQKVVSADVERSFMAATRDITARTHALRNRGPRAAQASHAKRRNVVPVPAAGLRHADKQTTVQMVSIYAYNASTCNNNYLISAGTYGTGICVAATSTELIATESTMFSYDSGVLTQSFYSDTACSTLLGSKQLFDLSDFSEGSCNSFEDVAGVSGVSFEYTVSSSLSLPNADGYYLAEYTSSTTCGAASQPFFAGWFFESLSNDDHFTAVTCFPSDVSFNDDVFNDDDFDDDSIEWMTVAYVTYGTTTESSSSKSSCFAGSETVELASGEIVSISNVVVGDRILGADSNGALKYSAVIAVPHDRNNEAAVFIRLETVSGKDIKMTRDHLVMVNQACDSSVQSELLSAADVSIGMCMMTTNGLDRVQSTSEAMSHEGIYTVVLADVEMLVVNGIVASPFAMNHATANAYYNVVRALPMTIMSWPAVKQANVLFGTLVASFGF